MMKWLQSVSVCAMISCALYVAAFVMTGDVSSAASDSEGITHLFDDLSDPVLIHLLLSAFICMSALIAVLYVRSKDRD